MLRSFIETLSAMVVISVIACAALLAVMGERLHAVADIDVTTSGPLLLRAQQIGEAIPAQISGGVTAHSKGGTVETPALGS